MESFDEIVRKKISTRRSKIREIETEIMQLKRELNDSKLVNRLPFKVMRLILEQLDFEQMFEVGKVCRKWSEYLGALRLPQLIIAKKEDRILRRWFFSGEECERDQIIVQPTLNGELTLASSLLVNLKKLKIINQAESGRERLITDFEFLNKLSRLELLEITEIRIPTFGQVERVNGSIESDKKSCAIPTITLPNLKQLSIARLNSQIKLNTPSLTGYRSRMLKNVNFVFPEQVTHLYFDHHYDPEIIRKLANLQYLFVNNADCQYLSEGELLDNHPKLEELSIGAELCGDREEIDTSNLVQLLNEKHAAGRDALKIVFRGVLFESMDELEENHSDESGLEKWISINYNRLYEKELRWIQEINYSGLEVASNELGDWVLEDFHLKFKHVRGVVIGDVQSEESLENFLSAYGERLTTLRFRERGCSEDFVENYLNAACPAIYSLTLRGEWEFDEFDFLLRFNNLYRLDTDLQLHKGCAFSTREYHDDDDIVYELYDRHEAFYFTFVYDRTCVSIKKKSKDSKFRLFYEDSLYGKYEQLSSLILEIKS